MAQVLTHSDDSPHGDNHDNPDYLKDEAYVKHFRVAIFGSARTEKEDAYYHQIFDLAKRIGRKGFDVVTGGGPGLMEAANAGHQAGRKDPEVHSIGLTIQLPWENMPNRNLDVHEHFNRFSARLDEFLSLSNVAVFTHGGVGTCLEFFYIWQHVQVRHVTGIPMILIGDMWEGLVEWLKHHPLESGLISPEEFEQLYLVHTNDQAMALILAAHDQHTKQGEGYKFNFPHFKALNENPH